MRDLDCVFFCENGPTVEMRDGLVHIVYVVGQNDTHIEVVIPAHAYLRAVRRCNHIAEQFHAGERNVVAFAVHEEGANQEHG